MDRRAFTVLLGSALAAPAWLHAQTGKRVFRVAALEDSVDNAPTQLWRLFRRRLEELGLAHGRDIQFGYASGGLGQLPALAAELVVEKPDLIVCPASAPTLAAMKATTSIPIVFIGIADPVAAGVVASLAKPGGNVTGVSIITAQLAAKQVELLRELSPGAKRLAFLGDASDKGALSTFEAMKKHALELKMTIRMLDGRKRVDLERSLVTYKRERLQGLIVGGSEALLEHRDRIVQFSVKERLPVVFGRHEYAERGGLLSYSPDYPLLFRRGAEITHRILKGAKPAELAVGQVATFRMVLNLRTARKFSIRIPGTLRPRANEVIQ